ncbi:MAG: hypothetical protein IT309_02485 [Anaerolineales bacterium]|nr:hypothetical protein [Anaerolineales bacterium]
MLLPKMEGVFGKWDWVANGVIFGFYHLHQPRGIPSFILTGLIRASSAKPFEGMIMQQSISLNSQNRYEIKIHGQLDDTLSGWAGGIKQSAPVGITPALAGGARGERQLPKKCKTKGDSNVNARTRFNKQGTGNFRFDDGSIHPLADSRNLACCCRADGTVGLGSVPRSERGSRAAGRGSVPHKIIGCWAGMAIRSGNDHPLPRRGELPSEYDQPPLLAQPPKVCAKRRDE